MPCLLVFRFDYTALSRLPLSAFLPDVDVGPDAKCLILQLRLQTDTYTNCQSDLRPEFVDLVLCTDDTYAPSD